MCGIAGYFAVPSYSVSEDNLSKAISLLSHRGPDDSGLYQDVNSGVGLAHTRLSILDLSVHGHQPMKSENDGVILVFNGEIYNFLELREELKEKGHIFRSNSDTEVLLQLYLSNRNSENLVDGMLRKLNGIFAFAIWDFDKKILLLARDALGVKPLYYSESYRGLFFGSELKALIPLMDGNLKEPTAKPSNGKYDLEELGVLNFAAIDSYLSFLWCPGKGTPLNSIKKLEPGQYLMVKEGKVAEQFTWYRLPVFRKKTAEVKESTEEVIPSMIKLTRAEAICGTTKHLSQAVHRQMVADVPVGAFLSGGLDSSSILAFARELNPDIRCFTIDAVGTEDEGFVDDLPYARRVAKHFDVPLDIVKVDAFRMAEDLPAMVSQMDEPLADPAPLNVYYISRLARENGIKVLLSGAGGDDLFTGYRRHWAITFENYWTWLPKSVRAGLEGLTSGLDQHRPIFRRLRKLFSGASLDGDARLVKYFRWVDRQDLMKLYSKEFIVALANDRAEDSLMGFLADLPPKISRLDKILSLEQRFFLADHNLTYTDKMSMAAGVEVRVPFLDLDLVEFASTIPDCFKQRGNEGKWVLKKTMEPYLPKEIIYRSKSGFGAPLRRWIRLELRDLLADLLSEQSLRARGLFDPLAVGKLIEANDKGQTDASYTLLSLMCIELWCRAFIDKQMVPSLSRTS
ncbi:MAG: asparagine synthase (glutamine-hydrolyzing) [Rhodopirellula sp.]|nr:asparagine synthase (glutamine-hydrolyzing) [Rhodopirellula sp.]